MEGRLDLKESPIRTERKTIHLPPDTIRALNKLAARNGTDFSKEVRRAIDEYLDLESTAENIDMISGVIRQELSGPDQGAGKPAGRTYQPPDDHIRRRLLCQYRHYRRPDRPGPLFLF